MDSGNFNFTVDSSLLFQLGERLVARPSIALGELVKNSYDADATEVTVTLNGVGTPGGTIRVQDDGHGMTFEEIRDGWMRIATSEKADNSMSRIFNRPLTGQKGVGRFAARRLGAMLTLQSVALREDKVKEEVTVRFKWDKFASGKTLAGIQIPYIRREVSKHTPTGVCLLIEKVRDAWEKDEILDLRQDLLSLQSPFPDLIIRPHIKDTKGKVIDPGFDIILDVPEPKFDLEGKDSSDTLPRGLGEEFLAAAWARLDGVVNAQGKAVYTFTGLQTGEKDNKVIEDRPYNGLENAKFRIYFMVFKDEFFKKVPFGVRYAQKRGREEGGVRVYVDGFRVFPFGTEGDDWLQLDQYAARNIDWAGDIYASDSLVRQSRSTPGRPFLLVPKNNQIFGAVFISQTEHQGIEINIARDRLADTPTFENLRQFVQNGLYWLTLKYASFVTDRDSQKNQLERPSLPQIIQNVKISIKSEPTITPEVRRDIVSRLDDVVEQAIEQEQERISEMSMLRILASAGTTISIMNHQLQALSGAVLQIQSDLQQLRPTIPTSSLELFDDVAKQVSEWHELMSLQISQLGHLLAPESRERRRRPPLYRVVENVANPMKYYMNKYGVSFENDIPRDLRTPAIYESELYAVLINILSNALKAVHGQPIRHIKTEAGTVEDGIILRMLDTGKGLPVERREIVFRAFETDSTPNPILGIGTGLGLKVVTDILRPYRGIVRFVEAPHPWKTCIEIKLPK